MTSPPRLAPRPPTPTPAKQHTLAAQGSRLAAHEAHAQQLLEERQQLLQLNQLLQQQLSALGGASSSSAPRPHTNSPAALLSHHGTSLGAPPSLHGISPEGSPRGPHPYQHPAPYGLPTFTAPGVNALSVSDMSMLLDGSVSDSMRGDEGFEQLRAASSPPSSPQSPASAATPTRAPPATPTREAARSSVVARLGGLPAPAGSSAWPAVATSRSGGGLQLLELRGGGRGGGSGSGPAADLRVQLAELSEANAELSFQLHALNERLVGGGHSALAPAYPAPYSAAAAVPSPWQPRPASASPSTAPGSERPSPARTLAWQAGSEAVGTLGAGSGAGTRAGAGTADLAFGASAPSSSSRLMEDFWRAEAHRLALQNVTLSQQLLRASRPTPGGAGGSATGGGGGLVSGRALGTGGSGGAYSSGAVGGGGAVGFGSFKAPQPPPSLPAQSAHPYASLSLTHTGLSPPVRSTTTSASSTLQPASPYPSSRASPVPAWVSQPYPAVGTQPVPGGAAAVRGAQYPYPLPSSASAAGSSGGSSRVDSSFLHLYGVPWAQSTAATAPAAAAGHQYRAPASAAAAAFAAGGHYPNAAKPFIPYRPTS